MIQKLINFFYCLSILLTVILGLSVEARGLDVSDLNFDSKYCKRVQSRKAVDCEKPLLSGTLDNANKLNELVGQYSINQLASDLKERLVNNGSSSLKQISSLRNFLTNNSKLSKSQYNKLQKSLSTNCGSSLGQKILDDSRDAQLDLNFSNSKIENLYKKDLYKRYGIAADSYYKLKVLLESSEGKRMPADLKSKIEERKNKILEFYPMAGSYYFPHNQFMHLNDISNVSKSYIRSDLIDNVLFPDQETGKFEPLPEGNKLKEPHRSVVNLSNQIFGKDMPKILETRIKNGFDKWYIQTLNSYSNLCKAKDCELLDIDVNTTFELIKSLPKSQRKSAAEETCACKIGKNNDVVSGTFMVAGAVLSVGTTIGCLMPPTAAFSCPVMFASTAGLAAASGVNTYSAIKDSIKNGNQVNVVNYLPGLTAEVRQRHKDRLRESSGRIISNAAGLVGVGGVVASAASNIRAGVGNALRSINVGKRTSGAVGDKANRVVSSGPLGKDNVSIGIEVEAKIGSGISRKNIAVDIKTTLERSLGDGVSNVKIVRNPNKGLEGYMVKYMKDGKEHVWEVIGDPSLPNGGVEIVSPVLSSAKDKAVYKEVIGSLSTKKMIKSDPVFGGVHVHVGAKDLSVDEAGNLVDSFSKVEKQTKEMFSSYSGRVDRYAKAHPDKFLQKVRDGVYKSTEELARASAKDKANALNLKRLLESPAARTVEYRMFNSTVDVEAIEAMAIFSEKFTKAAMAKDSRLIDAVSKSGSFDIEKVNSALDLKLTSNQIEAVKGLSEEIKTATQNLGKLEKLTQENARAIGLLSILGGEIVSASLVMVSLFNDE